MTMTSLGNLVADGTTSVFVAPTMPTSEAAFGRRFTIAASGDFSAGTLAIEISPDGGTTWVPIYSMTANEAVTLELRADRVRATLSGAGTPDVDIFAG